MEDMPKQKTDITVSFKHEYTTNFIIDTSRDFAKIGDLGVGSYERLFFVFDKNVAKLYQKEVLKELTAESREYYIHIVDPVEDTKSLGYYPKLVEFFSRSNAGRYDAVIAIGGGIVIDLVSFTVSTYMRGLPFFIVASTLIGQTDASTAGKTCLNSDNAKNLLGTFYYPKAVYNNIPMLLTCPRRIMRQGLSEAFKYSLLTDGEALPLITAFNHSKYSDEDLIAGIVRKTIESRIRIRRIDPLASNLGHTFGHALEKYFDYKVLHGDAILAGTVMAISYAVEKSLMTQEEYDRIFSIMKKANLNVWIDESLDADRLVDYMKKDKKSSAKKLHLVMICGIGKPYRGSTPFFEADYSEIKDFLNRFITGYHYKVKGLASFLESEVLE